MKNVIICKLKNIPGVVKFFWNPTLAELFCYLHFYLKHMPLVIRFTSFVELLAAGCHLVPELMGFLNSSNIPIIMLK